MTKKENGEPRLRIRPARPDDAAATRAIYAPYVEHTAVTFEYAVPSEEEMRRRIVETQKHYPYLVLEEEGRVVGYAYASSFAERIAYRYSCALSIYLKTDARGKGYGRRLYDALERKLRAMQMRNLYACVASPIEEDETLTHHSEAFHAHLGFETVGHFHSCGYKFDRWYDMVWMEKRIAGGDSLR